MDLVHRVGWTLCLLEIEEIEASEFQKAQL